MPELSSVPTPFSKKQPPPNDRPIAVTFDAAALKASALEPLSWPFQSLHCQPEAIVKCSVIVPLASCALPSEPSAHQKFVCANLVPVGQRLSGKRYDRSPWRSVRWKRRRSNASPNTRPAPFSLPSANVAGPLRDGGR